MRKFIGLQFFLVCFCTSLFAQKKLEVLFLGNSYTYVNDLPTLITQIALSKGDTLTHDENTVGGSTLQAHSTNATSLSKIQSKPWDFVVLQEQSQLPAFPPSQVATDVYPYADSLNKYIKKNDSCTNTLFFMTWGHQDGDPSNCATYPPICTYEGMQAGIRNTYLQMSQTLNAVVAPVGVAWKRVRDDGDSIVLYAADGSHPSIAGSYLAACTFYASMFHKSPIGAAYPVGVNPATALHLQQYAHQVVFDSLDLWKIDTLTVHAGFSDIISENHISLTNYSTNADSYFWNFGDGQSDTGNITTHTFSTTGTYTVMLVAFRGCASDTVIQSVNITSVGINTVAKESRLVKLFPDPASDYIIFEIPEFTKTFNYSILNSQGVEVLNGEAVAGKRISVSPLSSGMYCYLLKIDGKLSFGKFQIVR